MEAMDITTGRVIQADSAAAMSKLTNINAATIVASKKRKTLYPIGKYIFRSIIDDRTWPRIEDLPRYIRGRERPIRALNIDSGVILELGTVREMESATGVRESVIASKSRRRSNTHINRYLFRYIDDVGATFPELTKEFVEADKYGEPHQFRVYDILTGEVRMPVTAKELQKELGVSVSSINRAMRLGKVVHTYLIRKVLDNRKWPTLEHISTYPDSYGYLHLYRVTNKRDGTVKIISTLTEVAEVTGLDINKLRRNLDIDDNYVIVDAVKEALDKSASITGDKP
jgi:predicted transcriptional regulator